MKGVLRLLAAYREHPVGHRTPRPARGSLSLGKAAPCSTSPPPPQAFPSPRAKGQRPFSDPLGTSHKHKPIQTQRCTRDPAAPGRRG